MPLISSLDSTKLRSLKYSTYTEPPAVITQIPGAPGSNGGVPLLPDFDLLPPFGGTSGNVIDYFRGGTGVVSSIIADEIRIGSFLKSTAGVIFAAKQDHLSRIGVRTQVSGILNDGGYNPFNTLASVAGLPDGNFFNKQDRLYGGYLNGINPSGPNTILGNTPPSSISNPVTNRLIKLSKHLNLGRSTDINFVGEFKYNPNDTTFLSYAGGPDAYGGIGRTELQFTNYNIINGKTGIKQTNISNNSFNRLNSSYLIYDFNKRVNSENIIIDATDIQSLVDTSVSLQDFRKYFFETNQLPQGNASTYISSAPNYTKRNIETRINLGNPGAPGADRSSYAKGRNYNTKKIKALDTITAYPLYRAKNVAPKQTNQGELNDLVKFRIAAIDNDNPDFKVFMHFRAFLTTLLDSYSPQWDSVGYVGRGDKLYRYGGFTRKVDIVFQVVAQSVQELIPMYKKLNYLASNTMPDYSSAGYMRGPLIELTIGAYLFDQPGFISNLNFDVNFDAGWEIGIDDGGNSSLTNVELNEGETETVDQNNPGTFELPKMITVTLGFVPIPEFVPRKIKGVFASNSATAYPETGSIYPNLAANKKDKNYFPSEQSGLESGGYLVYQRENYIALTKEGTTFENY